MDIDIKMIDNILFKTKPNIQKKNSSYAWCFNINPSFILV